MWPLMLLIVHYDYSFVCIVKGLVFPLVVYKCNSWTIKKAKCWRTDAFELWCWRRFFRVPWIARRSNQSILKDINPEQSLEGLMLKLKHVPNDVGTCFELFQSENKQKRNKCNKTSVTKSSYLFNLGDRNMWERIIILFYHYFCVCLEMLIMPQRRKEPKCLSTDKQIKKIYIHTMEYYLAIKRNEAVHLCS